MYIDVHCLDTGPNIKKKTHICNVWYYRYKHTFHSLFIRSSTRDMFDLFIGEYETALYAVLFILTCFNIQSYIDYVLKDKNNSCN